MRKRRIVKFAREFAFKWNYRISNVDFVPNKRNSVPLGKEIVQRCTPTELSCCEVAQAQKRPGL